MASKKSIRNLPISMLPVILLFPFAAWSQITVSVDNTGLATATFTQLNCVPGIAILDWGDGCVNQNPSTLVQHQYQACGNFNVL